LESFLKILELLMGIATTIIYTEMHALHLKVSVNQYNVLINQSKNLTETTDTNIPNADNAMKAARSVVEYFTKSTQAMEKLLNAQRNSNLPKYMNAKRSVKVLQDVRTRWWSTWRMIRRLRFLKEAIGSLRGGGEVECNEITELQWRVLEDIQMALSTMAEVQRTLEGDKYVTVSLVPFSLFKIREAYVSMLDNQDISPPVQHLVRVLLYDLDQRYEPQEGGKITYFQQPERGFRHRYKGLHPFIFFAAALDPRTKNNLSHIMTDDDCDLLWEDILELMVQKETSEQDARRHDQGRAVETPPQWQRRRMNMEQQTIFLGFDQGHDDVQAFEREGDIRTTCELELSNFRHGSIRQLLMNDEGQFNDPLEWWKERQHQFKVLAKLAREFLAIPATSAPSERIWSRASRILNMKRASLDSEVASRIMFARENAIHLCHHYTAITGEPVSDAILPTIYDLCDDFEELDVGQGDF
jgi:hypothetical protein